MINAFGCGFSEGYGNDFDINKLRYDKIIIMADADVECNRHYPVPCHLQKAYAHLGYGKGSCPNAERLAERCVTLPLFPEMRQDEIERVIELCNGFH